MPKKDTAYRCKVLIRIESAYFESDESKYYPQVFLEDELDNRRLRIDSSDESANNAESEQELNSDNDGSDNESD